MFTDDLFSIFQEKSGLLNSSKISTPSQSSVAVATKRFSSNTEGNFFKKNKNDQSIDSSSLLESIPKFKIHQLQTVGSCTHEVALPENLTYTPLNSESSKTPAKVYPFILDPFQKEAILCIENNQSVLVSAHTSAGKTVVAEYAVALSLKGKQRVIYTTPIKALSNQKYRELFEEFMDVGLMTGDVTINPTASCLVMTTEILRSMLYRGSEVMREVAWVIFDEIHYMRDKERGVVWEESIILLPDNVHYVFLSATIPNARQFAEWISYLHKQPCHVVYTEYRPTPLQHYIFPAGGDGIHLVVDENGNFKEDNFNNAMSVLRDAGEAAKGDQKGRKGGFKGESNCFKIVKMIMERNFSPVIIFSFSRKDCEAYALQLSRLDFNNDKEKKLVQMVFNNAIDTLSDEDRKLPQVENALPLMMKGIGIHHSGLLPLLKEITEILFAEGLIKALCATETFAMGLNMPARTVLFTSARKFDGTNFRWISSGEYIQMSGRAGRRGLDDKGIVILMIDEKISPGIGKKILKGLPDPLFSSFHLTYSMVLNMLRVEGIDPEFMLERSFHQFQNFSDIPQIVKKLKEKEEIFSKFSMENEEKVQSYSKICSHLSLLQEQISTFLHYPQYTLPFLQPGRLIRVESDGIDFDWGVVVNFRKKANQSNKLPEEGPEFIIDVLLHLNSDSSKSRRVDDIRPCGKDEKGELQVVPVKLNTVKAISSIRIHLPNNLTHSDARMASLVSLNAVKKKFLNKLPLLDPLDDLGVKDEGLKVLVKKIAELLERKNKHSLHEDIQRDALMEKYLEKEKLQNEIKDYKYELKSKKFLLQNDQLKKMKRIIRRFGLSDPCDVIQLKGRVACEISCGDVLVLAELLFNGFFNDLNPEEICSILSCFTFQENFSDSFHTNDRLLSLFKQIKDTVRHVVQVSLDVKLDINEEEKLESFQPHMMEVVYSWSKGAPFSQICKMTSVFEGSIIRCMRRLEECLREMFQASKVIGNAELENKFVEGIRLIKRDIVFAASLYL